MDAIPARNYSSNGRENSLKNLSRKSQGFVKTSKPVSEYCPAASQDSADEIGFASPHAALIVTPDGLHGNRTTGKSLLVMFRRRSEDKEENRD